MVRIDERQLDVDQLGRELSRLLPRAATRCPG
jgi:hypothetical protein